ncbi:MAG: hypothetical protein UH211_10690 [Agathobacter sp.]|nr:hypothetical protein [Agathobacter sp.]
MSNKAKEYLKIIGWPVISGILFTFDLIKSLVKIKCQLVAYQKNSQIKATISSRKWNTNSGQGLCQNVKTPHSFITPGPKYISAGAMRSIVDCYISSSHYF